MNKLKAITNRAKALHSNDKSSRAGAPQSKASWKYNTACDEARQINGDVHGNIHIGDIHNHPGHISTSNEISAKV